ncbi:phage tail tape measure protein [Chitiniphilus shinanonensis]|uniref:phage tail tape measure protein n=1 Tax=Chitiniphilus shinanonensis TaxID=553088 RepID=UPI00304DDED5
MSGRELRLQVVLSAIDRATAPLRALTKSSSTASREVRDLQAKLKALNATQGKVDAYRQASRAVGVVGGQLREQQRYVQQLKAEMAATAAPTAAMTKELMRAQAEFSRLRGAQTRNIETQRQLRGALSEQGVDTKKLAAHQKQLASDTERVSAALDKEKTALARVNEQQRKLHAARAQYDKGMTQRNALLGAGASTGAAGAALGVPVVAAVRDYVSFEDAMLGVARQVPGARNDAGQLTSVYYDMAQQIKQLGREIPLATNDIADMVTAGARMEVPREYLIEYTRQAAMMATAFDAVPGEIAEQMGKVAKNFKMPVTAIRGLADTINYLDDNAIAKGADIIDVLNRISGVVSTVKMTDKAAAALASTLLTMGERPETAGTAISAMVQKFAAAEKGTARMQGALQELGLSAESVQRGMATDATTTIFKILDAINKLPSDQRTGVMVELVGLEHSDTLAKLVDKPDEFRRQLDMANSQQAQGSMAREFAARQDTLSAQWQRTMNRGFAATTELGELLRPTLVGLMTGFSNIVDAVTAWVRENPRLSGALFKVLAIAAALLTIIGLLMVAMAGVLGPMIIIRHGLTMLALNAGTGAGSLGILGSAFKWLGGIVATVGRAMLLNPIGLAITAIAVAAYLIYRYWAPIKQFFAGVWAWIDGVFDRYPILNRIFPFIGAARLLINNWGAIRQFFAGLWSEVTRAFDGGIAGIGALLLNWSPLGLFHRAFAAVLAWFAIDIPAKFTDFGRMMVDGLVGGIVAKWDAAKAKLLELVNQLPAGVRKVLRINSPSRVFATIGSGTMAGLAQGLERGSGAPLGAVLDTARRLTTAGAGIVIGATAGPAQADSAPLRLDTRPPLSARTGAGVRVAGDQVTIQISVGPGQDLAELRGMLAQLLDERDRTKAARVRSMLSDRD